LAACAKKSLPDLRKAADHDKNLYVRIQARDSIRKIEAALSNEK
jgi:hypothetical protein